MDELEGLNVYPTVTFREDDTQSVFCAFVDILGFGKLLDEWDGARQLYADLFGTIYPELANQTSRIAKFLLDGDVETPAGRKNRIRFSAFSDTMIVTSANLLLLVRFCANLIELSLQRGYALRGCISFGRHIEHVDRDMHLVVSTAVRDAYYGESRMATYPRIILHPHLLQNEELHAIWFSLRDWVAQSNDNFWQVTPMFQEAGTVESTASWLAHSLVNPGLLQKYAWLADFFNAAVPVDYERPDIYQSGSIRTALAAGLQQNPDWRSRIVPVWEYADASSEAHFFFPQRAGVEPLNSPKEFAARFLENWSRYVQRPLFW